MDDKSVFQKVDTFIRVLDITVSHHNLLVQSLFPYISQLSLDHKVPLGNLYRLVIMAASLEVAPIIPQSLAVPPAFNMMVKQEIHDPAYTSSPTANNAATPTAETPLTRVKRKYTRKTKAENGEMPLKKRVKKEPLDTNTTADGTPLIQQKITDHMPVQKRKRDRFKGMTEEEVLKRVLPDHIKEDLDILIVGINPGLTAAFIQHHYAGPGNHFWKCLYLSGMTPEPMNAMQDAKLLDYGIGFTNIVERTTRGSADLTRKEIAEGGVILKEKIIKYKPKIALFNGKGIYEVFCGNKNFDFGLQPEPFPDVPGTVIFVNPSSSARCTQLPRAVDKVPFFQALKRVRDHIREHGSIDNINRGSVTFPDFKLVTAPQKVKKEIKEEPGLEAGVVTNGDVSSKPKNKVAKKEKPEKPKATRRGRPTKKQQQEAAAATAADQAVAHAASQVTGHVTMPTTMAASPTQPEPTSSNNQPVLPNGMLIKHEMAGDLMRNDYELSALLQQQQQNFQQSAAAQQQQMAALHQRAMQQQHGLNNMLPMVMPPVKQERHDFGQYGVMPPCTTSSAPSAMPPYPLYNGYWNYLQCASTANNMVPSTYTNIRPQITIPANTSTANNLVPPSTPNHNPIIPQEASSPTMSNQSSLTQASLESLPKADSSLTVANWLQTIPQSQ